MYFLKLLSDRIVALSKLRFFKALETIAKWTGSILAITAFIGAMIGAYITGWAWLLEKFFPTSPISINIQTIVVNRGNPQGATSKVPVFLCFEPSFNFKESDRTLVVSRIAVWAAYTRSTTALFKKSDWQQDLNWIRYDWTGTYQRPAKLLEFCKPQKQIKGLNPSEQELLVSNPQRPVAPVLRFIQNIAIHQGAFKLGQASLVQVCLWLDSDLAPTKYETSPPSLRSNSCPQGDRFSVLVQRQYLTHDNQYRFSTVFKLQ
jgi:hypothetical protein